MSKFTGGEGNVGWRDLRGGMVRKGEEGDRVMKLFDLGERDLEGRIHLGRVNVRWRDLWEGLGRKGD